MAVTPILAAVYGTEVFDPHNRLIHAMDRPFFLDELPTIPTLSHVLLLIVLVPYPYSG